MTTLVLAGIRIISLALNLPGPAALMRLRAMGAHCTKVEGPNGDPMVHYSAAAYAQMHRGVHVLPLDLKTDAGRTALHAQLAQADVLITSFRPSALRKLGLDWATVHAAAPQLAMVCIVGAAGDRAEEPGHDLTYLAEHDLLSGTSMPATLFADMAGSLMVSEAVLQAVLHTKLQGVATLQEVALSGAASYLALPRLWGLTQASGVVGGAHAGYRVYPCRDGRVAVAALEPHFAQTLGALAGLENTDYATMQLPAAHATVAQFFANHSTLQLQQLATEHDLPLWCMPH
jgi:alpha-methylacyl-CoA racemase